MNYVRNIALIASALVCCACANHAPVARINPPVGETNVSKTLARQTVNTVDAGDSDLQGKVLRAHVDADPQNLAARIELANYYKRQGFDDIAVEHLRLACERLPQSEEAHIALAKMLRDTNRPKEAAATLRTFGENSETHSVNFWAWLGILEDDAGNFAAGEAADRKALALAPGRDDLMNNLGWSLLQQGKRAEAAEIFRAVLKENPQSVVARNNLGFAVADDRKEAVLNWQSAADPASAHNNMAVALIEAGNYKDAKTELATALDYNPRSTAALSNLRLIAEAEGKPVELKTPTTKPDAWDRLSAKWHRWSHTGEKANTISSSSMTALETQNGDIRK